MVRCSEAFEDVRRSIQDGQMPQPFGERLRLIRHQVIGVRGIAGSHGSSQGRPVLVHARDMGAIHVWCKQAALRMRSSSNSSLGRAGHVCF